MLPSHAGRQLQVSTLEIFNSFISETLLPLDMMGVFMKDPEFVILVFGNYISPSRAISRRTTTPLQTRSFPWKYSIFTALVCKRPGTFQEDSTLQMLSLYPSGFTLSSPSSLPNFQLLVLFKKGLSSLLSWKVLKGELEGSQLALSDSLRGKYWQTLHPAWNSSYKLRSQELWSPCTGPDWTVWENT